MTSNELKILLENLQNKTIAVVGDIVIDHYRILKAKRLSPEAPIPIFEPQSEEYRAGGAANVAVNLSTLGVGKVYLVGVLGEEDYLTFSFNNIISPAIAVTTKEHGRLTTIKERLTTLRQQVTRVDIQSNRPILVETANYLLNVSLNTLRKVDAIVFSDYDHGTCTKELISPILNMAMANNIPTIVDSKAKDTLSKYKGSTIVLPNLDEARSFTKLDEFEDEDIAKFLLKTMKLQAAAITLGPNGILLALPDGCSHFQTLSGNPAQEVVDVTGAGDTVAATVATGLTLNMSYPEIMRLANITAGIKVQKRGASTVLPFEIINTMEMHKLEI